MSLSYGQMASADATSQYETALHPHYENTTFADVIVAKRIFIEHVRQSKELAEFIDLLHISGWGMPSNRNSRSFVLYEAKKVDDVSFNGISAFALLSNETDWDFAEAELFQDIVIGNVQLIIIRRSNTATLMAKLIR